MSQPTAAEAPAESQKEKEVNVYFKLPVTVHKELQRLIALSEHRSTGAFVEAAIRMMSPIEEPFMLHQVIVPPRALPKGFHND